MISNEKADRTENLNSVLINTEQKFSDEKTKRIIDDNEIKINLSKETVRTAENISDISVEYYENKADTFDKLLEIETKVIMLEDKLTGVSEPKVNSSEQNSSIKSLENRLSVIEQTLSNLSSKVINIEHMVGMDKDHSQHD